MSELLGKYHPKTKRNREAALKGLGWLCHWRVGDGEEIVPSRYSIRSWPHRKNQWLPNQSRKLESSCLVCMGYWKWIEWITVWARGWGVTNSSIVSGSHGEFFLKTIVYPKKGVKKEIQPDWKVIRFICWILDRWLKNTISLAEFDEDLWLWLCALSCS